MSGIAYVAFDLGAESGRAMLASLDRDRLDIEEIHRFPNVPQRLPSGYHWNLLGLWANLTEGLRKCAMAAKRRGVKLAAVGVDTWGVDMAMLGKSGQLLGLPYSYRDQSHQAAMDWALNKLGRKAIYQATGIQIMPLNTLFQLIARRDAEPGLIEHADRMISIADLLHYFLCGKAVNEATMASTTQMIEPFTGQWNKQLLADLGLPGQFLKSIVRPGTVLGPLRDQVAAEAGIDAINVIAPASHDTASAVAAVPVDEAGGDDWAYLSSGTWSLMGAEISQPVVSDTSMDAGFTNERGVANKIRFLKNISGLWLVQEVRRDVARNGKTFDYAALTQMAAKAEPFATLIDPAHPPFTWPGQICAKIDQFAEKTGQPKPTSPGQYVRCCLESLALTYRQTLDQLEEILSRRIGRLHIVGGGSKNGLLNQLTADAIGRPVCVGPEEATAIGNALTQAIGQGRVKDLAHLRRIVGHSFAPAAVEPQNPSAFAAQRSRFEGLLGE